MKFLEEIKNGQIPQSIWWTVCILIFVVSFVNDPQGFSIFLGVATFLIWPVGILWWVIFHSDPKE